MTDYELVLGDCILTPYSSRHDLITVKWLSDPYIKETFGLTYHVSVESHRKWLESQNNLIIWAINYQSHHIGNVSIRIIERHMKAYFEMYIGDKNYRGIGIGKIVIKLIKSYVFNYLKLNRLYLYTKADNAINNNFYSKVGFVCEGTERQSIIDVKGEFCDQKIWSMLKSEYQFGETHD